MSLTFTTPRGFFSTCEHINTIADQDEILLTALIDVVVTSLSQSTTASTPQLPQIIQSSTSTFTTAILEASLNVLIHILNHVDKAHLQGEDLSSFLLTKTSLTPSTVTKLIVIYTNSSSSNQINTNSNNTTIAIQWKIGLIVSSSNCQQIYSPYVTFSLDVDNTLQTFELSVPEFQQFAQTIYEIQQTFSDL